MIIGNDVNLNILNDWLFKIVFGRLKSKKLLESFLERILCKKFEIEQVLNGEIIRELLNAKNVSLDVVVKTRDNTLIAIEVQNQYVKEMEKRLKYYTDRLSSTMLDKGDDYCKFQKIISIALLNHRFYKERKDIYRHEFKLLNTHDQSIYDDSPIEIIIFDKLKKENYNENNPLDLVFMYLYGLLTENELRKFITKDSLIREIEEVKNMISKSKEAEILKIGIEKREMDEQVRLKTAIKEVRKEAEEEAIKEKISIALKLKDKGFSLGEISEITSLSIEKLENLISKNH